MYESDMPNDNEILPFFCWQQRAFKRECLNNILNTGADCCVCGSSESGLKITREKWYLPIIN